MDGRRMRRNFAAGLIEGLQVVWSILPGLTIGHGDLAPKTLLARSLAVLIGVCGVLFTALLAAVAVKALGAANDEGNR